MESFINFEGCLNDDWLVNPAVSNFNDGYQVGSNVDISIVDSGADSICQHNNTYTKWKMPTSGGSQNGGENSNSSPWVVTLKVLRPVQVTNLSAWVQFVEQDELIQVPIQNGRSVQNVDGNLVEDSFTISLQEVLDMCTEGTGGALIKLILYFGQLEIASYDVCQFEIKELQVDVHVSEEEYKDGGTIGIRQKKQMVTGPHKGRCQRLERKDLKFFMKTNIALDQVTLRGYVRRVNDMAMFGKQKAVTGETEIPLTFLQSSMQGANDPGALINYVHSFTADLDPDKFYLDHPGKELYTSDKTTPENNIFIYGLRISVGRQSFVKEVYQFKTKSKEYSSSNHQYISAMELEATRAHIRDLKIQKLTTVRGDIAYSWELMDADTAGRYEEGDVVGIFPNKIKPNDKKTYLDLLTPNNYKEAIIAGVITRSYYIAANSQEDDHEHPCEKICMVGKISIKVSGPVKHGDFIYASNKLPGVGVTEEQLIADKGDWREKRLLGYSLETSAKSDVKLVSCVVSILLSINNDQVERLLAKMEESMSENFERKIDEFRDDVDIKMDGMSQIVSTTQDYVATKRREISRRTCRVCSAIISFFVLGILSSYFFLSPTSPYIKWECRRDSLPGTITFRIDNKNDDNFVRMEGILFDVVDLRHKIGVDFALKKNFTGSYYLNLRKCKRDNLRKVLGWFSNPPVYSRAQVFAASCDCGEVFHYHQYLSWVQYSPAFNCHCYGDKASQCNQTSTAEERKCYEISD